MESFYGGLIGLTPDIQIGTVIETDDVTKTEIELDPTSTDLIKKFNFILPKAKTGSDGKTPTFDIQTIEGGHRIIIKIDNQVIDTVDIMNGVTATLLPTVENTNLIFSETGEGGSSLVFDDIPIEGSNNPVKSNGIYQAIEAVQEQLVIDNVPTTNSDNLVKSGGVKSYVDNAITEHELTFDSSPIEGSSNPVTSDGIYRAIAAGQSGLTIDDVPTDNSDNLVRSGGVKSYVDNHTIDPNNLTTTVSISKGGTGASSAAAARTSLGITPANIGAAPSSHTHNASDINSGTLSSDRLPIVPIAKGGTNADNAADARTNLGITEAINNTISDFVITYDDGDFGDFTYYKTLDGLVHLYVYKIFVKSTELLGILPEGYRPNTTLYFPCMADNYATGSGELRIRYMTLLRVDSNGQVRFLKPFDVEEPEDGWLVATGTINFLVGQQ